MHRVHHSKGIHIYPQASYWDWPYTADKLPDGKRLLQIDRDWMWYKVWGRYAWNCDRGEDKTFWKLQLADYYGIDTIAAGHLLNAYDEVGEIAPKLLRRFGITEGNRQTLLLGMKMAQLVNPYKFNIYPGFYESCGPEGEKLIDFVERQYKGEAHKGELPFDIIDQCTAHAEAAANAIRSMGDCMPKRHLDEFLRVKNDFECYRLFAVSFHSKVMAASQALVYKWDKDINHLRGAEVWLEQSLDYWKKLCRLTDETYLYANSMQTSQRRIPVGGDNGKMKTWSELLPVYQDELDALKANIEKLKAPSKSSVGSTPKALTPAKGVEHVAVLQRHAGTIILQKGAVLFEGREDTRVDSLAPELVGLQALVLNRDTTRIVGTTVEFTCNDPVKLLVGFFQDDDPKWAKAPTLEVDATGNEYGQAEPILTNAVSMFQMPPVHIHAYFFDAGHHTINFPKGIIMVAGFTSDAIRPRDVGLQGAGDEVDWLFMK